MRPRWPDMCLMLLVSLSPEWSQNHQKSYKSDQADPASPTKINTTDNHKCKQQRRPMYKIIEAVMTCTIQILSYHEQTHIGSGTGFIYILAKEGDSEVPALITNKHVLKGANKIQITLTHKSPSGDHIEYSTYTLDINNQSVITHPDPEIDLCAILIYKILETANARNLLIMHHQIYEHLTATHEDFKEMLPLEEVTMVGYPNGLWDDYNNGAIARKGVIATIPENDYLGRPEFVIDMACFPGSSGSPIFLANYTSYATKTHSHIQRPRLLLIGILWGGPQFNAEGKIVAKPVPMSVNETTTTNIPINLGYAIKATELRPIIELAKKIIKKPE